MTTTLDTNHLRQLLEQADAIANELNELDELRLVVECDPEQACILTRGYLARSDALDEALPIIDRLLSGSHCWCGPEPDYKDEPCGHCAATAFLSRFPQETK